MAKQKKDYSNYGCIILFIVGNIVFVTLGLAWDFLADTIIGYFIVLILMFWVFQKMFDV